MTAKRSTSLRIRIAGARLRQLVGWNGAVGLMLIFVSLWVVAALRWAAPPTPAELTTSPSLATGAAVVESQRAAPQQDVAIPPVSAVPLLLTRIQRTAVAHGLGWARADYRLNPATDEVPASLDVKCVLKGSYPNVRAFVTDVLLDVPTLTLRQFNLSRPGIETSEVEAKLSFVVYLSAPVPEDVPMRPAQLLGGPSK